jgi:hypothetical protein
MLDDVTVDPEGIRPCWWVRRDPVCEQLPPGPSVRFETEYADDPGPRPATYVEARCLSCE